MEPADRREQGEAQVRATGQDQGEAPAVGGDEGEAQAARGDQGDEGEAQAARGDQGDAPAARGEHGPRWLTDDERDAGSRRSASSSSSRPPWTRNCSATPASATLSTCLFRLSEAPERTLRMSDLAILANGSLSRLSHVVTRLERRGWVRREACPGDGRYTNAVLTGMAGPRSPRPRRGTWRPSGNSLWTGLARSRSGSCVISPSAS